MPSSKRAVVCVSNDLCTDHRVHRTCATLVAEGYGVKAIGRRLPGSFEADIPNVQVVRMSLLWNQGFMFAWLTIE